jgi:PPP family 3-phenylpropionic acid transporter
MQSRLFASAIYFCYFAAGGALTPYLNLYYQDVGMSKQQIGVLIASTMLATVLASPIWGAVADAFRLHRYLLPLAMFGTLLPIALFVQATDFIALWLLIILYAFFNGPIIPLADNAVLEMLGEDRAAYGKLRVWGAVGFGLSAWGGGVLAEQFGIKASFVVFLTFMFLCGLVATRLPAPQLRSSDSYLRNLRRLSTNVTWLGFLGAIFLVGLCSSMIHNYLVLYANELGAGEGLYGLSIAIAGVSELPVFFFSAWLLRRLTPRGVLVIAFVAFVVRALIISVVPSPEWIILPQALHGLSFSALWAAGVVYVARITPVGLGATAQAALGTMLFGVSGAVGGLFGANLYELIGAAGLFRLGALMALLGLGLFLVVELRTRHTPVASAAAP